jgi:hypothetical protein
LSVIRLVIPTSKHWRGCCVNEDGHDEGFYVRKMLREQSAACETRNEGGYFVGMDNGWRWKVCGRNKHKIMNHVYALLYSYINWVYTQIRHICNMRALDITYKWMKGYPPIKIIGLFFMFSSSPIPACFSFFLLTARPITSSNSCPSSAPPRGP